MAFCFTLKFATYMCFVGDDALHRPVFATAVGALRFLLKYLRLRRRLFYINLQFRYRSGVYFLFAQKIDEKMLHSKRRDGSVKVIQMAYFADFDH